MQIPTPFDRALTSALAACLLVMMASCEGDGARVALPGKVGAAGELVVVAPTEVWTSEAGDTIQSLMGQPYPVLPQYEPLMDVCLLYTSPSPRDLSTSRMPSSA